MEEVATVGMPEVAAGPRSELSSSSPLGVKESLVMIIIVPWIGTKRPSGCSSSPTGRFRESLDEHHRPQAWPRRQKCCQEGSKRSQSAPPRGPPMQLIEVKRYISEETSSFTSIIATSGRACDSGLSCFCLEWVVFRANVRHRVHMLKHGTKSRSALPLDGREVDLTL